MNKSSVPDTSSQKKSFDYAWEFDSGIEVSINDEKYRNELVELYSNRPESMNSSLVVKEGNACQRYLNFQ